ncbi:MAG: chemotaxis protein CheW [Bacteroidales bacterium]|nr:chemotaxis protein CheW [Bacteroidales bacterium]
MDKNTNHKILQERARAIAQKKVLPESGEKTEVVHFTLHPEKFAIESEYVKEVISLENLTPLPGTPGFIMGIMNYRGTILSAVNLKIFLGLTETGLTEMDKVLIISDREMEFGIVADKIEGTENILKNKISEPPYSLSETGKELIRGLIHNEIIFLSAKKLLHHNQMTIDQKNK